MDAERELDGRLEGLNIANGASSKPKPVGSSAASGSSSSAANRMSRQYNVPSQMNKPFIPGARNPLSATSTSYFGSGSTAAVGGSSSGKSQTRVVGGGITNLPPSSTGAGANLLRKPSIDKLNAQSGSVNGSSRPPAASVPMIDVGRYDGGLERDERKGRRTGDHPDVLNIDSAAGG